jgi:hypothetical protein
VEQYVNKKESEALSPQWRAGAFRLLEDKKSLRIVLLYASEWADSTSAQKMYASYRAVLRGKNKRFRAVTETDTLLIGEGDEGYFRLERAGQRVTSIEGMSDGELREGGTSKETRFVN